MKRALILGCGYVGERAAAALMAQGVEVYGATRSDARAESLSALGITPVVVNSPEQIDAGILATIELLIDSIPLTRGAQGLTPSQTQFVPAIVSRMCALKWAAYLSTTGVYGDADGAWVDETTACTPTSQRGRARLDAESAWTNSGLPVELFRLAGIYGPGRNIYARLREGGYQAVQWQPRHWSNRIHVDDIVNVLLAAMAQPESGRIINVVDDLPLPHADYVCELAEMIGAPKPELLTPEEGEQQLSPMALEFFRDNKRISNRQLHRLLPALKYPTFRDAVADLDRPH